MLINLMNRLLEAGWLVACLAVPLFFNPYGTRVFDPDKTYLLRSIVLIMLACWLVNLFSPKVPGAPAKAPAGQDKTGPAKYLLVLAACFGVIYLVSSMLALQPYFSFMGYFLREEGLYTLLCYLFIFFVISQNLAGQNQIRRLVDTIILTATAVCIYGILQSFDIDTVTWAGGKRSRVTTTFGNPIFIGAYLIMVIPLIIARIMGYPGKDIRANYPALAVHIIALAINIYCLMMTYSRGPFVGWLASLFFLLFLFARLKQLRWLFTVAITLTVFAAGFFAVLNIPNGPLSALKKHFGRFGEIYQTETGSGKVRMLIWEGAASIIKSSPQRIAFGHGLESLFPLYHRHIPSSFEHFEGSAVPDHSHNDTFDVIITGGALGLTAYLGIIFLALFCGLKHLGLIPSPEHKRLFILSAIGGIVLGVVIPIALRKTVLLGLAIPAGFLSGAMLYLVATWRTEKTNLSSENILLIMGILGAIIAHFTELQFGMGVTSTRLYFWIYLGLLIAAIKSPLGQKPAQPGQAAGLVNQPVIYGILSGLAIAMLVFELIKKKFVLSEGVPASFYYIILTIGLFMLLFAVSALKSSGQMKISGIAVFSAVTLLLGAGFYYIFTGLLSGPACFPTSFINLSYIFTGIALVILGVFLPGVSGGHRRSDTPYPKAAGRGVILACVLLPVAVLIAYYTNLNQTYADAYCREGENHERAQPPRYPESIGNFSRSIELSPRYDYYHNCLARVYKNSGNFGSAAEALKNALKANPLNLFHQIELARCYRDWASASNPAANLESALREYEKLILLTPNNPRVYKEKGDVRFSRREFDNAIADYQKALALDGAFFDAYPALGRVYRELDQPDKVIETYSRAHRFNAQVAGRELVRLGEDYFNKKRYRDSLNVNLALITLEPKEYRHYHNTAVVLEQMDRLDEAIEYSKKAVDLIIMPPEKEGYRKFLKRLEEKRGKK